MASAASARPEMHASTAESQNKTRGPVRVEKAALLPAHQLTQSFCSRPKVFTCQRHEARPTHNVAAGDSLSKVPSPALERELKIKVVLLGGKGVGKSAIVRNYCNMPFVSYSVPTIGFDIFSMHYKKSETGREFRVELWDVSNMELNCDDARWARIANRSAAFFLVAAANDHKSFDAVEQWRRRIAQLRPVASSNVFLLVNKDDVGPQRNFCLDTATLEAYTKVAGLAGFAKTSAKTGAGVTAAFDTLVSSVLSQLMAVTSCRRNIASTAIPYLDADCTTFQPAANKSVPAGVARTVTHSSPFLPSVSKLKVVEDVLDMALPTEAFETQDTAAVLTTRRPEHIGAGAYDGADEVVDMHGSALSTHVVILRASLRQCMEDVQREINSALEETRATQEEDYVVVVQSLKEALRDQFERLQEEWASTPSPADKDFVDKAADTLRLLHNIRRHFLELIAEWHFAFQTLRLRAEVLVH